MGGSRLKTQYGIKKKKTYKKKDVTLVCYLHHCLGSVLSLGL